MYIDIDIVSYIFIILILNLGKKKSSIVFKTLFKFDI